VSLFILGEEPEGEGVYCELYFSRGEDELGPRVFTHGKDWFRDLVSESK